MRRDNSTFLRHIRTAYCYSASHALAGSSKNRLDSTQKRPLTSDPLLWTYASDDRGTKYLMLRTNQALIAPTHTSEC
jgi:hypothetical protein